MNYNATEKRTKDTTRERELYSLQKREESEDTRELWDICPPEGGGGYVIGGTRA